MGRRKKGNGPNVDESEDEGVDSVLGTQAEEPFFERFEHGLPSSALGRLT